MSKKDYELIARVVADTPMTARSRVNVTRELAWAFDIESPRFDSTKFIDACLSDAQLAEAA